MTRRVGVLVVVLAVLATSAFGETVAPEKAQSKAAPTKKAAPKTGTKAPEAKKQEPVEEPAPPADAEPTPEELEAALPPHINGPKLVDVGNNIEIDLPAGMILFERAEAKAIIEKGGGHADSVNALIGKVDADWMVVVEYEDVGYVTDTDADKLDASELFGQYQEGTKQQNVRRKSMGMPELYLDGWSEMPVYNKAKHHLVWGLKGHNGDDANDQFINFFTRILGRHGYMSVDLIDSPDKIEQSKQETAGLLVATRFKTGFTYEDYREGDKNSGMGLRALVVGGTGLAVMKAAKAGILIKLLLVFKKGLWLILVPIIGFFKWLFGRKKDVVPETPPSETPPSDDPNANG
jgi:uncharacterized membrane-anchored protein